MPKLALDTSAYIAYVQNDTAVTKFVDRASSIGLPIIVIGELYFGIFDGSKSEQNSQKLNRLLASPRVEILNVDETSARIFGEISTELKKSGKPIQQNDVWIAALCKQYSYPLATSDKGFERITGLELRLF